MLPGRRDEGDVRLATGGKSCLLCASLLDWLPKDCSKGFGSRLKWFLFGAGRSPWSRLLLGTGRGGGARGCASATPAAVESSANWTLFRVLMFLCSLRDWVDWFGGCG